MNILIPHSWLLEHLETSADPQTIQKLVSLSGPSIERIYDKEGESVYDIEVTTNRVDSMSVRGIAREVAVILSHAGIESKLKPLQLKSLSPDTKNLVPLPKINNTVPQFCRRINYVVLKNVKRTPTPEWMAKRLRQVDINVHDSVIDITNYIAHELGYTFHAFDYDQIMKLGGEIIVTEAKPGEKFAIIDGTEFETVGGEIVFKNTNGLIIDLPAIKGTANTSINPDTKNVLLWTENLDPKKVRYASMTHAIRTVAAQLAEKNLDPNLADQFMLKGVELYQDLCEAEVASELYDDYPVKRSLQSIKVPVETIHNYLGVELPVETITQILIELGCNVDDSTINHQPSVIVVTPPTFRPDLTIPADIVEEIARIYGYHNLPSVLMPTAIPLQKPVQATFDLEQKLKTFLVHIGWQEVYTYSMVSEELALQSGYAIDEHVTIQNPLTDDRVYMRNSLIPSLNEVIDQNPMEKNLSVFEIANVYWKQKTGLPFEVLTLSLVSNKSFRAVKGDVEALLDQLFIKNWSLRLNNPELPYVSQSAVIFVKHDGEDYDLGTIVAMKNGRVAVSLGVTNLWHIEHTHPTYQPIPTTAQIVEDLTFTLPEKTLVGEVIAKIREQSDLIASVELKDVYKQNYTFSITYLDRNTNLTSELVEPIRKKIAQALVNDYKAELVGNI